MTESKLIQFPEQSVNDAGEIVDLQLWVDEFEKYFDGNIVREIKTTIEVGLQTAPYILISCAIDFLGTFWAGTDSNGTIYRDFVNTFFGGYDGQNLYRELRCRMVHNHTVGERAVICWNEPDIHKCTINDGTVVLNLGQFFEDFIQAKSGYFAALRVDPELLDNHKKRFYKMGVLRSLDPDDLRDSVAAS
jgi:hypothetical protein